MVEAPYGSWPSPVTAELLVASTVGLGGPAVDGDDVWWSELRPAEGGRVQLVRRGPDGTAVDVLPEGLSARTRVHEYGGGAWLVADGVAYATSFADQRVYRIGAGGDAVALTPTPDAPSADRYADLRLLPGGDWLVCVREHHGEAAEAVNELVAVSTSPTEVPDEPVVLWSGADFVSNPRVSPDGSCLSWLAWNHPDMPWDANTLWVADLVGDLGGPELIDAEPVAGGAGVSVAQPEWSPSGVLHLVSDAGEGGFWNLWSFAAPGRPVAGTAEARTRVAGELAQPQWVFGQSWLCFTPAGDVVGCWRFDGIDHLGVLGHDDPEAGVRWLDLPFTSFDGLTAGDDGRVVLLASSFTSEAEVIALQNPAGDARSSGLVQFEVLRPGRDLGIEPSWWSVPEPLDFPSADGRVAHALYYPPTSPTHRGSSSERPPLLVLSHGGPTAAARPQRNLAVQAFTSRGWAVADVNYAGSTGYGRPYRRLLDGAWGIADVQDCEAAAAHLVARGDVDGDRLAIKGGSAGGFTTLCALAFGETFTAGSSHYGVADLEALARDTHKFESRYLDSLVGPWPEGRATYEARSPIHHVDGFACPVIVFQGLEDAVVPPDQSERIVDALRSKGIPVAYLAFEGEQHGFRRAETIRRVVDAEQYFFSRVFGFELAEAVEPVPINDL